MFSIALTLALVSLTLASQRLHPDVGLDIYGFAEKYGYPMEFHEIKTEDGYILGTQRIPHGRYSNTTGDKVVFILHGLQSSSVDFVNTGPNNALAFILADLGYDVWLGNARGNVWSRKHEIWNPDVDEELFWNFSWHEIGFYDVPANIDYILQTTKVPRIFYIGHSQGTTSFFVMASTRPEYNDKIVLMSALGPSGYQSHMFCPILRTIASYEEDLEWIALNIGLYEFKPASNLTQELGKLCDEGGFAEELCRNVYFLIFGYDSEQLNSTLIPVILTNLPGGSGTKQHLHYAQEINSGYFRQWDYHSDEENILHYGQPTPPNYDISQITAPIALHYGKNDWLVALEDVYILRDQLPNLVMDNKIAYEKFNHADFIFASDVVDLLYNDVIAKMEEYKDI